MKQRKLSKGFIINSIVIIFCAILIGFLYYRSYKKEQNLITEIKNSYSEYVTPIKTKNIYQKENEEYKKIGKVYSGMILPLVKKNIVNSKDVYYQIKDTDYYLHYKDLKKANKIVDTSMDYYIVTKEIHTNPTKLYCGDKLCLTLNKNMTFDVLLVEQEKYYVKYQNQIYYIQDHYELKDKENNIDLLKDISVFNFSDDISDEKMEDVLKFLKENNKQSITINDFKRWIQGNSNLENNKILLLSYQELSEEKKKLAEKYEFQICTNIDGIIFQSGDTKLKIGDTTYYKYEVKNNTTINRVKDMLNGIKEVPPEQGIAVLNYHFFYDKNKEDCNESICLDVRNFRNQLDYLEANGYKTLTMQEFTDWMYRRRTLPNKSVLITIDDGALGTSEINGNKLIPILEEYKMHATLFLITGWWHPKYYESKYLEIASHGNELHNNDGGTAIGLKLSKEEIKQDLQASLKKVDNNLAFCYPFYAKNNTMVEAIKEVGFQVAFVGGNKKATQSMDKYTIPRYIIYKNTSMDSFISMVR